MYVRTSYINHNYSCLCKNMYVVQFMLKIETPQKQKI